MQQWLVEHVKLAHAKHLPIFETLVLLHAHAEAISGMHLVKRLLLAQRLEDNFALPSVRMLRVVHAWMNSLIIFYIIKGWSTDVT